MVLRHQKSESNKVASPTPHHGPSHQSKLKESLGLRDKVDQADGNPPDNDSPLLRFLREGGPQGQEKDVDLQPVDWLANPQMLKAALPTARIMEFAYTPEGSKAQNIPRVAADFSEALSKHRTGCLKRPVMFIAHGRGGSILQRVFTLDRATEELLRPRFEESIFPRRSFAVTSQGEQISSSTEQPPITTVSPVNNNNLRQAKRTSVESTSSSRRPVQASALQPTLKPEILNVVIGTIFLETQVRRIKDDKVLFTSFTNKVDELGIPARWYYRKRDRRNAPPVRKVKIPLKNIE